MRVISPPGSPRLIADQPVKGLGLDGKEIGNLKVFSDSPE